MKTQRIMTSATLGVAVMGLSLLGVISTNNRHHVAAQPASAMHMSSAAALPLLFPVEAPENVSSDVPMLDPNMALLGTATVTIAQPMAPLDAWNSAISTPSTSSASLSPPGIASKMLPVARIDPRLFHTNAVPFPKTRSRLRQFFDAAYLPSPSSIAALLPPVAGSVALAAVNITGNATATPTTAPSLETPELHWLTKKPHVTVVSAKEMDYLDSLGLDADWVETVAMENYIRYAVVTPTCIGVTAIPGARVVYIKVVSTAWSTTRDVIAKEVTKRVAAADEGAVVGFHAEAFSSVLRVAVTSRWQRTMHHAGIDLAGLGVRGNEDCVASVLLEKAVA